MKQYSFFRPTKLTHGGGSARGRRKGARPLSVKRPLHLILKARDPVIYGNGAVIHRELKKFAARFGLRLQGIALHFDHIHLVLQIPSRKQYRAFIRALSGSLARKFGANVWAQLPFTRIVAWGRDLKNVLAYLGKNRRETRGLQTWLNGVLVYDRLGPVPIG